MDGSWDEGDSVQPDGVIKMKNFYDPTPRDIAALNGEWDSSYSGGKDSTALVTWIEWLRRTNQIYAPHPRLVQCDTTVEYVELLTRIGDDNIKLQNVLSNMTNIVEKKNGDVQITFVTGKMFVTPNEVARGEFRHVGLLLWLPKKMVDEIFAEGSESHEPDSTPTR